MKSTISVSLPNPHEKYKNIINDEKFYSSPEFFEAYNNYRNQKGLTASIDQKEIDKAIDEAIKQAVY